MVPACCASSLVVLLLRPVVVTLHTTLWLRHLAHSTLPHTPPPQRLASEQLKVMEGQGINPGPSHYNPLLQALASAGRNDRAMALLSEVNSNNLTWLPPDADSYNALLAGMLLRLKPGGWLGVRVCWHEGLLLRGSTPPCDGYGRTAAAC